jgi:hypothetical protein
VVLLAALAFTRTCGSRDQRISQDEAIAIATKNASFEPCDEKRCVLIRAVNQGIPVRLYWLVGLAKAIDPNGNPVRAESFLIDMETGTVTRR